MKTNMKTNRFWIEIVALGAGVACVMALLLACLGAAAAVAAESKPPQAALPNAPRPTHDSRQQQAYEGMVTCSRCGAKHSPDFGKTAADCSRACVHGGAQFALVQGEKTYLLDGDVALVKKLAGQRARIVGAVSGNKITVSSAAAAS
ncbi:MAG TPA: hypothetical protein VKR60_14570 [Candidatus Sulfotelmatobacter sp.]|nr:hypothetical protein [Candidatus Sulfotelmatobacter sp.]